MSVAYLIGVNGFVAGMLTFIFTRARQRLNVSLARVVAKAIHLVVSGWTLVTITLIVVGHVLIAEWRVEIVVLLSWALPVVLGEIIALLCTRYARAHPPVGATGRREWLIAFLLTMPFSVLFAIIFATITWSRPA